MIRELDYLVTVNGLTQEIEGASVDMGYRSSVSTASFTVNSASTDWLGDPVSIYLGYDGNPVQVFQGYINDISWSRMPGTYEISCGDILQRAEKHFIVTNNLDSPWSRRNIAAEDLVGDLLEEAGITNYQGETSGFTFGVSSAVEFNVVSVLDAIGQLNHILFYVIYADFTGKVWWKRVPPEPSGTPVKTLDKFISLSYTYGTKDLRNKVVVFGKTGINAEASASSPYLPADFYQTAIVSSALIDQQSMADSAASYNLDKYNKLTEELKVEIEGDPSLQVRDTVHITDSRTGLDNDWFVYSVKHSFDEVFTTSLYLRR